MRKFFIHIVLFVISLLGLYFVYYAWETTSTRLPQADIYVWGDSRMYWGLGVEQLSSLTGKSVCPTQAEGGSVYDMLTFVNRVPANSLCILGFSECVLFRDHELDYNRSGLNIWAVAQMLRMGYSICDVYGICKQNKWTPKNVITPSHDYFEVFDTVATPEPMQGWVTMYNKEYPYFEAKSACYDLAMNTLLAKNCSVALLDFSGYSDVEALAQDSPNRIKATYLKKCLAEKYKLECIEVCLESDSLLFYDLSHLNRLGAFFATKEISDRLVPNIFIRIVTPNK